MMKIKKINELNRIDWFLPHIAIEFLYNENRNPGFYLGESIFHDKEMLEHYGVFRDCYDIAKNIVTFIKDNSKKNSNIIYHIPENSLTDTVNLDFTHIFGIIAGYDPSVSVYDKNNKKFNEITIVISDIDKVTTSAIMHELQHAKEDLELRKKNKSVLSVMAAYGYNKLSNKTDNSELEKAVTGMLYFFTNFERNAFMCSIRGEIEEKGKTFFRTFSELSEYIKNTRAYKDYDTVLYNCKYFINITDMNIRKNVLSYMNSKSNLSFKTYHQLRNWLKSKYIEYRSKIDDIISKMAFAFYENKISKTFSLPQGDICEIKRISYENNQL